jgi:hypothetical protein
MFISQNIRSIQAQQAPAQDAVENALCALGWTCSALYSAIAQRLISEGTAQLCLRAQRTEALERARLARQHDRTSIPKGLLQTNSQQKRRMSRRAGSAFDDPLTQFLIDDLDRAVDLGIGHAKLMRNQLYQ